MRTPTYIACSGIKHLEEIRRSGLELPDVNQIEVGGHDFTVSRWELEFREPPHSSNP